MCDVPRGLRKASEGWKPRSHLEFPIWHLLHMSNRRITVNHDKGDKPGQNVSYGLDKTLAHFSVMKERKIDIWYYIHNCVLL